MKNRQSDTLSVTVVGKTLISLVKPIQSNKLGMLTVFIDLNLRAHNSVFTVTNDFKQTLLMKQQWLGKTTLARNGSHNNQNIS